ncbi:MAG: sodium:solute symporter family protein [Saprospiraceae bacterium]|nr:sodium:solute symporter family protein [Saprospiraceae bacterium]
MLFMALMGAVLYFFTEADVSWPGYIAMIFFYGLIFFMGAYAGSLRKEDNLSDMLLAGRSLPLWIAVFTMSATWLGGGFINGTAEYTADPAYGLIWVQAPWGYALSLILGGLFFAGPMRRYRFQTMLDPLQRRFGQRMTGFLFLPALFGELFWTAAILTALGTTFGTILGLDTQTSIVLSAFVAIAYTAMGGLWAVALTDIVQMILLVVGLCLIAPAVLGVMGGWSEVWPAYRDQMGAAAYPWPNRAALGEYYWVWWDYALLLIMGGIPWQVYFQRVLAARDVPTARRLSVIAGFVCLFAAVPAVLIGMTGAITDWKGMGLPEPADYASILPHVIRYLTNPWLAAIGLGAVAAAVMSSVDSSILSASSMTSWNIYRPFFNPNATEGVLFRVLRRSIWIIGIAALLLALQVQSVYQLWFLCSDLVYCLLFPALVAALFDPKANVIGVAAGFLVAAFIRFGGGEPTLGMAGFLPFPVLSDETVAWPFRTMAMASGLFTIFLVSRLSYKWFPPKSIEESFLSEQ